MGKLDGKVVIVTGTSRGIGKAMAMRYAAEGASVACVARTMNEGDHRLEGSLANTIEAIHAAGGEATPVQANVSSQEDCASIVGETIAAYGRIDVLVNNAAMTTYHPVAEFPVRRWKLGFDVNIHAPFLMAQLVLPGMIDRGDGWILNISSSEAIGPGPAPFERRTSAGTMYGASKAALERFTQGLAYEVYDRGISVTCLAPSTLVATPGATFVQREVGRVEPVEYMVEAGLLLITEPPERLSGRVCYSQALLKEFGLLNGSGEGTGIDEPGSGFAQMGTPR